MKHNWYKIAQHTHLIQCVKCNAAVMAAILWRDDLPILKKTKTIRVMTTTDSECTISDNEYNLQCLLQ